MLEEWLPFGSYRLQIVGKFGLAEDLPRETLSLQKFLEKFLNFSPKYFLNVFHCSKLDIRGKKEIHYNDLQIIRSIR